MGLDGRNGQTISKGEAVFRALAPGDTVPPWEGIADIAPILAAQVEHGLGAVVGSTGLDLRTRQLATICMLSAIGGCEPQLTFHVAGALNAGATPAEIIEAITQVSLYAGFPRTLNALAVARRVLAERGIERVLPSGRSVVTELLGAFQTGDLGRAAELAGDAVVVTLPTGTGTGRGDFEKILNELRSDERLELTFDDPLAAGDRIVLSGTALRRVTRSAGYTVRFALELEVVDGLLVRCTGLTGGPERVRVAA